MNWYKKTAQEVLDELSTDLEKGLSAGAVHDRLLTFGRNELASKKQVTLLDIFVRQFKSPLIYILIIAAVLVFIIGDVVDSFVIITVITINAVAGTIQEGRARNSLERLRSLTRHRALVRRGGEEVLISADELVLGDILIIKEGDRIGADARIIKEESFKVDESILTGEAYAVEKNQETISKDGLVVGDQKNMVFAGTSVVSGYCLAVVVATGLDSELGKISKELKATANVPLPLANKIERLTHFIAIAVFGVAGVVLVVGLARGITFLEIFGAAVGMVVSLVPEGLPVAVTIVLARGVWRMAKAKAIVRQMAAVEAMGNADTLLVDKTGTITTGKMVIREVLFHGEMLKVSGEGYEPKGKIEGNSKTISDLSELLKLAFLSLKADTVHDEDGGWKPSGDPTEVAVAVLCRKLGLVREKLEKEYKTIVSNPFDQKKRYIEAVFEKANKQSFSLNKQSFSSNKKYHVFVGAPDFLSKSLKVDHGLITGYHELAKEGLRVIGVAVFEGKKHVDWALLAIDEEIRSSAIESIRETKKVGFRICMLTGDYPETAKEIARKVGIYEEGDLVLTGAEVEKMTETELEAKTDKVTVFARITPEHKLKIVKAFQRAGRICAMTGDGVNDAPALQAANLGIGLGSGTQVAKDSSDIVLVNNNFETIVDAIAEGRAIYLSLKKVILYLFSTSFGEVLVLTGAILSGLPLPLVAVQIIWLNFVTDGFFVVALAQDNPTKKQLKSRTDVNSENLVDKLMIKRMFLMGGTMLLIALPTFYFFINNYSLSYARTMSLLILSITQWFNALNVRSRTRSVFTIPINNNFLAGSFVIVFILQLLIIQTGAGNNILHTEKLSLGHWLLAFGLSTIIIWVEEIRKYFIRRRLTING